MRIKCESCGKVYNTDVDELCPECGAYNSFDTGACTHYDSGANRKQNDPSQCGHTKIPVFRPKAYQPPEYVPEEMDPQEYVPEEMDLLTMEEEAAPQGDKWPHRPARRQAEAAPRKKKGKAYKVTVTLLVLLSIFLPPLAEAAANRWAYHLSAAPQGEVVSTSPQEPVALGGEFYVEGWQAQRVQDIDGTSYLYVTAQAQSVLEISDYFKVEPYMEAAGDFWAPSREIELEEAMENRGCLPDTWGLYYASREPLTIGWIFPDLGGNTVFICFTDVEPGPSDVLQSSGKIYQIELAVTEGGDFNGSI